MIRTFPLLFLCLFKRNFCMAGFRFKPLIIVLFLVVSSFVVYWGLDSSVGDEPVRVLVPEEYLAEFEDVLLVDCNHTLLDGWVNASGVFVDSEYLVDNSSLKGYVSQMLEVRKPVLVYGNDSSVLLDLFPDFVSLGLEGVQQGVMGVGLKFYDTPDGKHKPILIVVYGDVLGERVFDRAFLWLNDDCHDVKRFNYNELEDSETSCLVGVFSLYRYYYPYGELKTRYVVADMNQSYNDEVFYRIYVNSLVKPGCMIDEWTSDWGWRSLRTKLQGDEESVNLSGYEPTTCIFGVDNLLMVRDYSDNSLELCELSLTSEENHVYTSEAFEFRSYIQFRAKMNSTFSFDYKSLVNFWKQRLYLWNDHVECPPLNGILHVNTQDIG